MSNDSTADVPVRLLDATAELRRAGLALLAEAEAPERRELLLRQLQSALSESADRRLEAVALQSDEVVAYFCSTRLGSDIAILLGPAVAPSLEAAPALVKDLCDRYHERLAAAGIGFVQALRDPSDDARWLKQAGYRAIATLDYLAAPVPENISQLNADRGRALRFQTLDFRSTDAGEDSYRQFCAAIEETYEGTQDCPEIAEFRTTEQVVRCYLENPSFRPSCWMLAQDESGIVGVLITTPHRGTDVLELTYMGIAPAGRGKGYGSQLVACAFRIAHGLQLREVVLAVDRRNRPAHAIYDQFGFSRLISERVWVRSIDER